LLLLLDLVQHSEVSPTHQLYPVENLSKLVTCSSLIAVGCFEKRGEKSASIFERVIKHCQIKVEKVVHKEARSNDQTPTELSKS